MSRPRHAHSRRSWRVLIGTVVVMALLLGAFAATAPRDDAVRSIDAVVVLGGGGGERLALGQGLAAEHDAELVLSGEAIAQGTAAGLTCEEEVRCLEPDPWTTAGEARGMDLLADAEGWDHVAVATSDFHTARSRALFEQCLGDKVDVVGAPTDHGLLERVSLRARELLARLAGATFARAC